MKDGAVGAYAAYVIAASSLPAHASDLHKKGTSADMLQGSSQQVLEHRTASVLWDSHGDEEQHDKCYLGLGLPRVNNAGNARQKAKIGREADSSTNLS